MKTCKRCNLSKQNSEFSLARENVDSLNSWCKSCHREYQRDYRRTDNHKKVKERFMKKVGGNSGYYKKYKSVITKATKKYSKTESGKLVHRIAQLNYSARKRNAEGSFNCKQWEKIKLHYSPKGKCLRCKNISKMLVPDHIVPLAKGGNNYITNIQPLCPSCNCGKGAWNSEDYRYDLGEYSQQVLEV